MLLYKEKYRREHNERKCPLSQVLVLFKAHVDFFLSLVESSPNPCQKQKHRERVYEGATSPIKQLYLLIFVLSFLNLSRQPFGGPHCFRSSHIF